MPTICAAATFSGNATPVRLQLKWRHQFQFAGFYTALEKGYYREAGFDVTILPATPGTDPVETVLKGGADFGVASSELVLRYAKGDPVVVLASIFQHSPLALFVRRDAGIDTVHDLAGHKVALAPWETEIFAYLQRERVPIDRLQLVQHDYSVDTLVQGRVDALAGYETDETYYLQQSGGQYRQFTPRSSGVDFYGDTLFTTRAMVTRHPEWAEAFRAASLRGWEYALAHQEEIAALIHAKYAPDLPVEKLRFEAERMKPLMRRISWSSATRTSAAGSTSLTCTANSALCPAAPTATCADCSTIPRSRLTCVGCCGCLQSGPSSWRWSSGSRVASITSIRACVSNWRRTSGYRTNYVR